MGCQCHRSVGFGKLGHMYSQTVREGETQLKKKE